MTFRTPAVRGSFALVSDAILAGVPTPYDFVLDGVRHGGEHRGILTWTR